MAKFHVNPKTGTAGECSAKRGNCPFGGDEEHFSSEEQAREAYENSMAHLSVVSHGTKESLAPDVFVSVWNSSHSDLLTESFAPELGSELEPGQYMISYREGRGKDKLAKLTVRPDGSVNVREQKEFESLTSPASEKTKAAVVKIHSELEALREKSQPVRPVPGVDPVLMGELSSEVFRKLQRFDWNTSEGATLGRKHFEDLEWTIEHDMGVGAKNADLKSGANGALGEVRRVVGDFLDTLGSRAR